jgi:hypothetical protein
MRFVVWGSFRRVDKPKTKISDVRCQRSARFTWNHHPSSPSNKKTMVRRRYLCYSGILSAIGGASAAQHSFGLVSSVKRSLMVRRMIVPAGEMMDGGPRVPAAFVGDRPTINILRGGSASSSSPSSMYEEERGEEEEEDGTEIEEEEDDVDDEETAATAKEGDDDTVQPPANVKAATTAEPVDLTIQTASGSAVLDQPIELENVIPSRTIHSIKSSISKKLAAKPPPSTIALRFDGRLLADGELVQDIVKEAQEEEEELEEGDSSTARTAAGIVLTMDTIVPVDPKFVPDLERKISDLTSQELLQAYAANEAALYQNSLFLEQVPVIKEAAVGDDDDAAQTDPEEDDTVLPQPDHLVSVNAVIRDRIARIRADLDATVLATENAKTLLADAISPNAKLKQQPKVEIKGQRIRRPEKSIALRGVVQRNLNINWYYTGRAMFALIFCGYFGGKTNFSKSILLLGAPLIVIMQLRPVKAVLTQILYAILLHPPSIVLSLLPVPQQVLLSMDVEAAMIAIYGDQLKEPVKRTKQPVQAVTDEEDDVDEQEEEDFDDFPNTAREEDEEDADDDDAEDEYDSDESFD